MEPSQSQTPANSGHSVATAPVKIAGCHLVGYTEHPRMSEETTAFDAEVHLDGQQVGVLSNTGRGGESTFTATSAEGHRAFTAAEGTYMGVPDTTYGVTLDLVDVLTEVAATAKGLGGRSISLVPDMEIADVILAASTGVRAYKVTPRPGEEPYDIARDVMRQIPEVQTLMYPVREKKGHWLHVATR